MSESTAMAQRPADAQLPTIAVLGGSGREGGGLAFRWAHAGYPVVIGSRDPARAVTAAAALNDELNRAAVSAVSLSDELNRAVPGGVHSDPATAGRAHALSTRTPATQHHAVIGTSQREAAAAAEIVVFAVPYSAQLPLADEVADLLAGKIVVDVTVPLVPPRVDRVQLPAGGSAVQALQDRLGQAVRVISAFQNISATHLRDPHYVIDCDVLVCGDDADARQVVIDLAAAAGLAAWHAGPLANSVATEALTSILIAINKRYKVPASGIRITGVPGRDARKA